MTIARLPPVVPGLALLLVGSIHLACASGGSDNATEGEVGGPCYGNSTCDYGYLCEDDVCVIPDDRGKPKGVCYPNDTCDEPYTCHDGTCVDMSSCPAICATAADAPRFNRPEDPIEPDELCTEAHDPRFAYATTPEECCGIILYREGIGVVPLCDEYCASYPYYWASACIPPFNPDDQTRALCGAYLEHYNGLECTGTDLSDTYCDSEDGSVCSRGDYWTCLLEGTSCDGQTPIIDISDCNATCN